MKRIIYQALTRLWGDGKFYSWDENSLRYVRSLGADYIWLTGIPRHATGRDFVKGEPGSPYSISDWMDVNPYMAADPERRLSEFDSLVKRVHDAGLKLIIDYVPNHVSRDYRGGIVHYDYCDGDWSDTLKNNWTSPQTLEEMHRILSFWTGRGVDGFRCDMVELVPAEAMKELILKVRSYAPETLFVAEVYGRDNYRRYLYEVGFDLLYDKSGMYDVLRSVSCGRAGAEQITWTWQFLSEMQPRMLNFLENHDEQRIASPFFLGDAGKGDAALAVSLLFNDASFMLYFGQEAGEDASESSDGRTSIFNWCHPRAVGDLYRMVHSDEEGPSALLSGEEFDTFRRYSILLDYAKLPVFREGSSWDLCYCNKGSQGFDSGCHFVFLRYDKTSAYLVFANFSGSGAAVRVVIPQELSGVCPQHEVLVRCDPYDAAVLCLRGPEGESSGL